MPDLGVGPRVFSRGAAVATLTVTPQSDKALVVRRILIENASATDEWVITVGGAEVGRFWHHKNVLQDLLGTPGNASGLLQDIFSFCERVLGEQLVYPVPNGQKFVIASAGGATADFTIIAEEYRASDSLIGMVNHPRGNTFLAPLYFYRAAAVAAVGESAIDSQKGLSFVPSIFASTSVPFGWQIDVLALFTLAESVNTFSGAADHISRADYLAFIDGPTRLFTRDDLGGIPLTGDSAAAGAAHNTLFVPRNNYPPLQVTSADEWQSMPMNFTLRAGQNIKAYLDVQGSITGNPDYSAAIQTAICRIRQGV